MSSMDNGCFSSRFFEVVYDAVSSGARYVAVEAFPSGNHKLLFERLPVHIENELAKLFSTAGEIRYATVRPDRDYGARDLDEWKHALSELIAQTRHESISNLSSDIVGIGREAPGIFRMFFAALDKIACRRRPPLPPNLTDEENELVQKLGYYSRKYGLVLVCEDIENWSVASRDLLSRLLYSPCDSLAFPGNTLFIVFDDPIKGEELWEPHRCIKSRERPSALMSHGSRLTTSSKTLFSFSTVQRVPESSESLVREVMAKIAGISIADDNAISPALLLAAHDLDKLEQLCIAFGDGYEIDRALSDDKEFFLSLLSDRLRACDAEEQVANRILKLASILGLSFSKWELEKLSNIDFDRFESLIDNAKATNLLKDVDNKEYADTQFVQQFIYDLVMESIGDNERGLYLAVERLLRAYHPGKYEQRAKLLLKGGKAVEALDLYVLSVLQKVRQTGKRVDPCCLDLYKTLCAGSLGLEDRVAYLELMQEAYALHVSHEYHLAQKTVERIDMNLLPLSLRAEAQLLEALCAAKSIQARSRERALRKLEEIAEMIGGEAEVEIWERVAIQKMITLVHVGRISDARHMERDIVTSLDKRISYDRDAARMKYELDRISGATADLTQARIRTGQAVKFFQIVSEKDLGKPLISYYKALVNSTAKQVICGRFEEAEESLKKAVALTGQFPEYQFPRQEILANTGIVLGVLMGQTSPSEAIERFSQIGTLFDGAAENLFFLSNKAIMYALCDQFEQAFTVLDQEASRHEIDSDREKIYRYRYRVNCAVFLQLIGDNEKALQYISLINDEDVGGTDCLIERGRLSRIRKAIEEDVRVETGWGWCNLFQPHDSSYFSDEPYLYRYYGLGFVFTICSDWDI